MEKFSRYLEAKKTVDDRSLNLAVYRTLTAGLAAMPQTQPLKMLEIGCGSGAMTERLWNWRLVPRADYTALDRQPALVGQAQRHLQRLADAPGVDLPGPAIRLRGQGRDWHITFQTADYLDFCRQQEGEAAWDLLLAHAFLDLVDLDLALPALLSRLRPGGWYYFTLNFDGETVFQPPSRTGLDDQVIRLYHQSMDQRQDGRGGQSRTGRRLLHLLSRTTQVLAAGSSDWIVWPSPGGTYPAEEAYFLHYLLETMAQAVGSHPDLDRQRFRLWLSERQAQVEAGELVFLAHQLDLCGQRPPVGGHGDFFLTSTTKVNTLGESEDS